jgi:hypothetical protein
MQRTSKATLAVLALTGVVIGSSSVSVTANAAPNSGAVAVSGVGSRAEAKPMIWHLVIRIALTKAGCENIRRVMPNKNGLKCVKAGKVWVLIPTGKGY